MTWETLACRDPLIEFASNAATFTLQGQLYATWPTGPSPDMRGVDLASLRGRVFLER